MSEADEIWGHPQPAKKPTLSDAELTKLYAAALNHIGMLAMGELAYTSEFTEQVQGIVRRALALAEKGNKL